MAVGDPSFGMRFSIITLVTFATSAYCSSVSRVLDDANLLEVMEPHLKPGNSCYDILAVSKTATDDELKDVYEQVAAHLHPDKGGDAEVFKLYDTCWNKILKENRTVYDNKLDELAAIDEAAKAKLAKDIADAERFTKSLKEKELAEKLRRQQENLDAKVTESSSTENVGFKPDSKTEFKPDPKPLPKESKPEEPKPDSGKTEAAAGKTGSSPESGAIEIQPLATAVFAAVMVGIFALA